MNQQVVVGLDSTVVEEGQLLWVGRFFVVSPDGRWVAVVGQEHTVEIWQTGQPARPWSTYYGHRAGVYNRTTASILALAWVDDDRVVSESQDGSIHCWYARTGNRLRTFVEAGQPRSKAFASVQDVVRLVSGEEEGRESQRYAQPISKDQPIVCP